MGAAVCRVRRTCGDAGERKQIYSDWQNNQLRIGHAGLDARIGKDIDEIEGGTYGVIGKIRSRDELRKRKPFD